MLLLSWLFQDKLSTWNAFSSLFSAEQMSVLPLSVLKPPSTSLYKVFLTYLKIESVIIMVQKLYKLLLEELPQYLLIYD